MSKRMFKTLGLYGGKCAPTSARISNHSKAYSLPPPHTLIPLFFLSFFHLVPLLSHTPLIIFLSFFYWSTLSLFLAPSRIPIGYFLPPRILLITSAWFHRFQSLGICTVSLFYIMFRLFFNIFGKCYFSHWIKINILVFFFSQNVHANNKLFWGSWVRL